MLNKFCKKPLYEVTRTMANVAMGVEKADMVIKNARLVNVCTAEIQEHIAVAIAEGRIALVGDASHCIGENTKIIDAQIINLPPPSAKVFMANKSRFPTRKNIFTTSTLPI